MSDNYISVPKSFVINSVDLWSYDGYISLPEHVVKQFVDITHEDVKWKQICELNGWKFPTKE